MTIPTSAAASRLLLDTISPTDLAAERVSWHGMPITTLSRQDLLAALIAANKRIDELTAQRNEAAERMLRAMGECNSLRRELQAISALTEIEP